MQWIELHLDVPWFLPEKKEAAEKEVQNIFDFELKIKYKKKINIDMLFNRKDVWKENLWQITMFTANAFLIVPEAIYNSHKMFDCSLIGYSWYRWATGWTGKSWTHCEYQTTATVVSKEKKRRCSATTNTSWCMYWWWFKHWSLKSPPSVTGSKRQERSSWFSWSCWSSGKNQIFFSILQLTLSQECGH